MVTDLRHAAPLVTRISSDANHWERGEGRLPFIAQKVEITVNSLQITLFRDEIAVVPLEAPDGPVLQASGVHTHKDLKSAPVILVGVAVFHHLNCFIRLEKLRQQLDRISLKWPHSTACVVGSIVILGGGRACL